MRPFITSDLNVMNEALEFLTALKLFIISMHICWCVMIDRFLFGRNYWTLEWGWTLQSCQSSVLRRAIIMSWHTAKTHLPRQIIILPGRRGRFPSTQNIGKSKYCFKMTFCIGQTFEVGANDILLERSSSSVASIRHTSHKKLHVELSKMLEQSISFPL